MNTAHNTPVEAPESKETPVSGVLSRLPKPVQRIVLATMGAATFAATPEAQTATILQFSGPVISTTTPEYVSQATTLPGVDSRLQTKRGLPNNEVVVGSIFTVTITSPTTINLSWDSQMGNGDAPGGYLNGSSGYLGVFDVNMIYKFGPAGGTMSEIATVGATETYTNAGPTSISPDEGFNSPVTHFSKNIQIDIPGDYEFIAELQSINAASFGDTSNLDISTIPEPSTVYVLGVMSAAGLFIRRRLQPDESSNN